MYFPEKTQKEIDKLEYWGCLVHPSKRSIDEEGNIGQKLFDWYKRCTTREAERVGNHYGLKMKFLEATKITYSRFDEELEDFFLCKREDEGSCADMSFCFEVIREEGQVA